jgi:beta-lactamase superfamily II metal-dependent hydrolase
LPQDAEGNNASLVLRISFGECVLLFMGDAEKEAEQTLLSRDTEWDCDFLKVGHHGSRTACSQEFLAATTPQIAAISCAVDNDYGFPHEEVLDALRAVGAAVYRTDEQGTLRFLCDGKSIVYEE